MGVLVLDKVTAALLLTIISTMSNPVGLHDSAEVISSRSVYTSIPAITTNTLRAELVATMVGSFREISQAPHVLYI